MTNAGAFGVLVGDGIFSLRPILAIVAATEAVGSDPDHSRPGVIEYHLLIPDNSEPVRTLTLGNTNLSLDTAVEWQKEREVPCR